ncbi:LOW QUALITY PROTEIN: hypothetical protein CVT25_013488 [Psilocybe cyanescens]|uniref:Uncharacterized protein n=1 Tax=Psilocybe cyanescens TaxID=93625 RepID=A0A409XST9_PSICY|nr:LOW QUALITY PROTEIN: hypothetical protein CVT25_013488 [Psilocybe cyanescens]
MRQIICWLEHPMCWDLQTEAGRLMWQKQFSSQNLSVLRVVAIELGCKLITTDICKTKEPNHADYSCGILYWVGCIKLKSTMIQRVIWHQAPTKFGLSSHRKLKADQWHVLGTTLLPITLTHLWSNSDGTDNFSERCCRILEITLHLVSAVVTAISQVTSAVHAETYLNHILTYLHSLKALVQICSNQHIAIHLYEYLVFCVQFIHGGPFHLKGLSACCNESPILGEYKETISHSFMQASNLWNLFHRVGTSEVICYD